MTHPAPTTAPSARPPPRGEGLGVGDRPRPTGQANPMTHPLAALEQTLWRTETRHDRARMDATFSPDFFEFGRSGRRYSRDDLLPQGEADPIDATLHRLTVSGITDSVALVTYISQVRHPGGADWANRSSLWHLAAGRWQLCFHQGTPCEALP